MLVRLNSESIAFHSASSTELDKTNLTFDGLISTQYRLYLRQYFLNLSINLFEYFGSILSYLILAIPIFSGTYDDVARADLSSIISQNSFVTLYLIFQFTTLVDISIQFSDVTGVCHRIGELIERLAALDSLWRDVFPLELRTPSSLAGIGIDIEFGKATRETIRREKLVVPIWTL